MILVPYMNGRRRPAPIKFCTSIFSVQSHVLSYDSLHRLGQTEITSSVDYATVSRIDQPNAPFATFIFYYRSKGIVLRFQDSRTLLSY